ncbi:CHAT domain-containing protein [Streptomyces phaeochromogenes]
MVARLSAALNAGNPELLRAPDVVPDALALLREAAPSPDLAVDLEAVAAVCWTFWYRHQGPEDPDAQLNQSVILGTIGFLFPRVSADTPLPQPLRDTFDSPDPMDDARFAQLVSSAYSDRAAKLGKTERWHATKRALLWFNEARRIASAAVGTGAVVSTPDRGWLEVLRDFVELMDHAASHGEPPPFSAIAIEVLDLRTAAVVDEGTITDQLIARCRSLLAAMPVGTPSRYVYVAVLAALTGARAQAVRETHPAVAAELTARARSLTDEVEACAPADFLPLGLLRADRFFLAVPVALRKIPVDAQHLDAGIVFMRGLLEDVGDNGNPLLRAPLAEKLGRALHGEAARHRDFALFGEAATLLRYAHEHGSDRWGELDELLAVTLTRAAWGDNDAERAREAAALLASLAGREAHTDIGRQREFILHELFNAMQNYEFGHEPAQLERARGAARRLKGLAARAGVSAEDRVEELDVEGDAYLDYIEFVGSGHRFLTDLADLTDEQLGRFRSTFSACPPGHSMRAFTVGTLSMALFGRAVELHGIDPERAAGLLDEVEQLIDAVEGADEPYGGWADITRTFIQVIRGERLPSLTPSGQSPEPAPLAPANSMEAMRMSLEAATSDAGLAATLVHPALPAHFRAREAIWAAQKALSLPQPLVDEGLSHLETAVEAMAEVTDRGSDQESAEYGLSIFEGSIREVVEWVLVWGHIHATAVHTLVHQLGTALEKGRPPDLPLVADTLVPFFAGSGVDRATELLERGRGLLLTRRIEARTDITELSRLHPQLAAEFERLTGLLAQQRPGPTPAALSPPGEAERFRLTGLRTSRELDALIDRIRAHRGFEDFLRPLTAAHLRSLAAEGPIVVLNHASRDCYALIVTRELITALRLEPEADEITNTGLRLRGALAEINALGPARPSPKELITAAATVRDALSWTWHKIVHPILGLAECADLVRDGDPWPRIWWMPTGAFHSLPLHAAQCASPGCAPGGCGAALDSVVSSYVPGFQTLAYARARARHRGTAGNLRALLVASPEDELPGAALTAFHVAGLFGARDPLIGSAATREVVLAALDDTPWVHFGCHATTDPAEPSGAVLHLPSGERLSALEICRAHPHTARLAFLAACGTAQASERLSDEAVHITSAFLLAGFPAAVGTLWEIDSTDADAVTRAFYRHVTTDHPSPAHALHHTLRNLRHRIPQRPHVWAAYVHAGT